MHLFFSTGQIIVLGIILPPLLAIVLNFTGLRQPKKSGITTCLASALSLCFSLVLFLMFLSQGVSQNMHISLFSFDLTLDALSIYFILTVNMVTLFASFATIFMNERNFKADFIQEDYDIAQRASRRFHLFFNLFFCSMLLLPMIDNLMLIWLLMLVAIVFTVPLIGYNRHQKARLNWKYLVVSSGGLVIALLGLLLLFQTFSSVSLFRMNWPDLLEQVKMSRMHLNPGNSGMFKLSFLLVLFGYGMRAGLFPMQLLLSNEEITAPAPVNTLLSGVLLKVALYIILRYYVITNVALAVPGQSGQFTSVAMLTLGLISLVIAVPFVFNTHHKNNFKWVLGYLNMEHTGIIFFGFGLGRELAFFGALLHTLNHALSQCLTYLVYGNVHDIYAPKHIDTGEVRGLFHRMPITACLLALGGLALAGTPPFSISSSILIILSAALQQIANHPFGIVLVCLFVVSVALVFCGMVAHLGRILLGQLPLQSVKAHENRKRLLLLGLLLFFLIFTGFTTYPLTTLLAQSAKFLCQGICP